MAFEFSIFSDISRALSPELPKDLGSMDQYLDYIIPKVAPYGEDLREQRFWIGRRWKEVRDEEGFHEAILHIFTLPNEYLLSLDGNLIKGTWRQLNDTNSLIIEINSRSELFDLRFLNGDFIVLSKHGDQVRKGQRKYFMLGNENSIRNMDWRNVMEKMYNVWRENSLSIWAWIIFIIVVGFIIFQSF